LTTSDKYLNLSHIPQPGNVSRPFVIGNQLLMIMDVGRNQVPMILFSLSVIVAFVPISDQVLETSFADGKSGRFFMFFLRFNL
jgi:hypothetical protein